MPAVVATLRTAWDILADLRVPAALMGGLALAHWGHVRSTQDVDLLIALTGVRPHTLLARLAAAGYRSKGRAPLIRLENTEFIQLLYEPPQQCYDVQIDLLLADSPFHRDAIARRVALPTSALGFEFDVVSCEDLIVLKLIAGRILDRDDVAELLKANRDAIELGYLTGWVHKLGYERGFRDAWNDAFPGDTSPI